MNINYKEAQFEFFPNTASAPDETKRPHIMAARFNLTIENLVIFSIVSIMVVIFTFSIGVERGKRLALRDAAALALDPKTVVATGDPAESPAPVVAVNPLTKVMAGVVKSKTADATVAAVKGSTPSPVLQPQDALKGQSGGYTVQVASYKSEKSAQREALALQKKGLKAFTLPKGQHVVLCVGNFQKREEASTYGKKLKSNYQDYVVRRL